MNRKGMSLLEMVGLLVLVGAVIWVGIELLGNGKETTENTLDGLRQCDGGFLTSLASVDGKPKEGGCFKDKACTTAVPKDTADGTASRSGVTAVDGFYWQNVGTMGCDPTKDKNEGNDGETWYCCIQLPADSNPLRAKDVNRAKCLADLKDGEWAIQDGLSCTKITKDAAFTVPSTQEITFIYKPKAEDSECQVFLGIAGVPSNYVMRVKNGAGCYYSRNSDGVVTFTQSPIDYLKGALNSHPRINLAVLNKPQTFDVALRSGSGTVLTSTTFKLSTTNSGTYYCSLSSGLLCGNRPFNAPTASGATCKPGQLDTCTSS